LDANRSFQLKQIEKKIENSYIFAPWPRLASGEKIYGSTKLTITIQMDGTIVVIEPSHQYGHEAVSQSLSQSAIKVVEAAAPFAPLPKELFPNIDAIRFTRSFNFVKGPGGK